MKERIWTYVSDLSSVAAVEIYLLGGEQYSIRYVTLQKVKNSVKFIRGEYHLETLNELNGRIDKKNPLALSISGKGVMTKLVSANEKVDTQELATKVLPNYSPEEFFVQISEQDKHDFVSLGRRSDLERVLEYFDVEGFNVLSLTLGPFAILDLWSYLNSESNGSINFGAHSFFVEKGEVTNYNFDAGLEASGIIVFAEEELNENLVIAYATGLSLMAGMKFPQILLETLTNRKEEFVFLTVFKRIAIAFLMISFVVLIANFFGFLHYSSKTEGRSFVDTDLLSKELNRMNNELKGNEELANTIMKPINTNYSSLSEIVDLLASSVPEPILLNRLLLFPKNEKLSRIGGKPVFDFGKVIISGICRDGNSLNDWMEKIREEEFCKHIEIAEYSAIEKKQSSFTLALAVN